MSVESWDSRSFGSAECVNCSNDICDDLAGLGAVLCVDCMKTQRMIHTNYENIKHAEKLKSLRNYEIDFSVKPSMILKPKVEPSCCDYHGAEGLNSLPCATWQGGSNYAPNFGEENEGDEYDLDNELFKSHIHHAIDTDDLDILELLRRWESLSCPSGCGENITFEEEGSSVFACCDSCRVGADLNYVFP